MFYVAYWQDTMRALLYSISKYTIITLTIINNSCVYVCVVCAWMCVCVCSMCLDVCMCMFVCVFSGCCYWHCQTHSCNQQRSSCSQTRMIVRLSLRTDNTDLIGTNKWNRKTCHSCRQAILHVPLPWPVQKMFTIQCPVYASFTLQLKMY